MTKLEARLYSLDEVLAMEDEQPSREYEPQIFTAPSEVRGLRTECEPATKTIGEPLSWEVCVKYEPRLVNIVRRIEAIKRKNHELKGRHKLRYSFAQDCWYGHRGHMGIRDQLSRIIGWHGDTPYEELRSQEAHDICYRYLFDLLTS